MSCTVAHAIKTRRAASASPSLRLCALSFCALFAEMPQFVDSSAYYAAEPAPGFEFYGERLGPLSSQSYAMGSRLVTSVPPLTTPSYEEDAATLMSRMQHHAPERRYGYRGFVGSIVNPPPPGPKPEPAPLVTMKKEDTWVWQQAEAARRRARERDAHVRAVTAGLRHHRDEYAREHAMADRRRELLEKQGGPERSTLPGGTAVLDFDQRNAISKAEEAAEFARRLGGGGNSMRDDTSAEVGRQEFNFSV